MGTKLTIPAGALALCASLHAGTSLALTFAPTAAPEPASFFLIGCGLVVASLVSRRRTRSSND